MARPVAWGIPWLAPVCSCGVSVAATQEQGSVVAKLMSFSDHSVILPCGKWLCLCKFGCGWWLANSSICFPCLGLFLLMVKGCVWPQCDPVCCWPVTAEPCPGSVLYCWPAHLWSCPHLGCLSLDVVSVLTLFTPAFHHPAAAFPPSAPRQWFSNHCCLRRFTNGKSYLFCCSSSWKSEDAGSEASVQCHQVVTLAENIYS